MVICPRQIVTCCPPYLSPSFTASHTATQSRSENKRERKTKNTRKIVGGGQPAFFFGDPRSSTFPPSLPPSLIPPKKEECPHQGRDQAQGKIITVRARLPSLPPSLPSSTPLYSSTEAFCRPLKLSTSTSVTSVYSCHRKRKEERGREERGVSSSLLI